MVLFVYFCPLGFVPVTVLPDVTIYLSEFNVVITNSNEARK